MVLDNIEKLLEKYDNGETTLQEEEQLKNYFSQETVAPHLEVYKPMFTYFLQTQKEQFTKTLPLKPRKTNNLYRWMSVAAAIVVLFGIFWKMQSDTSSVTPTTFEEYMASNEDVSEEQRRAYNQTMRAFTLLASNFEKGKDNLDALGIMKESLDKGSQNIAFLGEFENSTNKIFNKN